MTYWTFRIFVFVYQRATRFPNWSGGGPQHLAPPQPAHGHTQECIQLRLLDKARISC